MNLAIKDIIPDCRSIPEIIEAPGVTVRRKRHGEPLVAHFDTDRWHSIVVDVDHDATMDLILERDPERIAAFMFCRDSGTEPFAWCMIQRITISAHPTFEFHGGAWISGMLYDRLKVRASVAILDWLLAHGCRVRSKAHQGNRSAIRFLEYLGFREVSCNSSGYVIHFTLSRKRLPKC